MRKVTVARFHQVPHIAEYGNGELMLKCGLHKGHHVEMSVDDIFLSIKVRKAATGPYAETLIPLTNVVALWVELEAPAKK